MQIPNKPRFLICRLSAVGDTVHTLPLANLIKQRWPDSYVAWAVEKGAAPLVQNHAAVDQTVVVPKGFLKSPSRMVEVARELRKLKVNIALDPQSLTKSSVVAWLSGAKRRIGFVRPIAREIAPWMNTHRVKPRHKHVVRRYLEVLRPLGVEATAADIHFDLAAGENSFQSLDASQPFAVLNPGAGWDSKVWPAERYAAVARGLSINSVVVWSGDKERAWAEEIVAASAGRARIAPSTTLLELTDLVRRARLFVGSDTGPLHIAAAVDTACVGLYGPTRPEVCGPFGNGHLVLRACEEHLGSSRKAAGQVSQAMLQITPDQVLNACHSVLGTTARLAA